MPRQMSRFLSRQYQVRFLTALTLSVVLLVSGTAALGAGSTPVTPATPANPAAAPTAAPAQNAQGPLQTLDRLELTIAPEWDQPMPQVFGDIAGSLINKGTQPVTGQEILVRLPKNGRLNSVCELSADPRKEAEPRHDTLAPDKVQVTDKGDYLEVSWKMTKTVQPGGLYPFHVEFYFSGLTGGPDKSVKYAYDPTYEAAALSVAVAEPKGATTFKTTLGQGTEEAGGDGLKYHIYNLPAVRPGQPVPIEVSYNRASNEASLPPPTQSGSQGSGSQSQSGSSNTVPLLVAGLVVLGMAGLFLMSGRPQPGRGSRRTVAAAAQAGGVTVPRRERRASEQGRRTASAGRPTSGKTHPAAGEQAPLQPAFSDPRARALEMYQTGQIGEEVYRMIIAQLDAEEGR